MLEPLLSRFLLMVTATHVDGSTFEQHFSDIESAFSCRRRLLAQGWTVVTVEKAKHE